MTKVIPIAAFACSICGQQHPNPADAIACHDSHPQPDYVTMSHICAECKEECGSDSCALKQHAK